jgi:fumarylacetoacetate (FAA) hydrolase family protein
MYIATTKKFGRTAPMELQRIAVEVNAKSRVNQEIRLAELIRFVGNPFQYPPRLILSFGTVFGPKRDRDGHLFSVRLS